jgi:uncharacterized protein with PIN domain
MADESLEQLKEENRKLREELKKLQIEQVEFASHKIYKSAQSKFIGWLSIVLVAFTAFGFISISNIIDSINKKIEEKGIERIVDEIKTEFIKEHQAKIVVETTNQLIPRFEEKADLAIQEFLQNLKVAEKQVSSDQKMTLSEALEQSYGETRYYVIVGSSPRQADLFGEKKRITKESGATLKEAGFPDLIISDPLAGNPHYALRFNGDFSLDEAKNLRERAIEFGFRRDTYISRVKVDW